MAERLGINQDGITNYTNTQVAAGKVTPEESAAYVGGIGNLFAQSRNLNFPELGMGESRPKSGPAKAQSQNKADRVKDIQRAVRVVKPKPQIAPIESPAVSLEESSKAWGNAFAQKEKDASSNYSFLNSGVV
jgi:hypothetical protein